MFLLLVLLSVIQATVIYYCTRGFLTILLFLLFPPFFIWAVVSSGRPGCEAWRGGCSLSWNPWECVECEIERAR